MWYVELFGLEKSKEKRMKSEKKDRAQMFPEGSG
jgi:hypothetical protein